MAKLVFGMNQSLDGYVDHLEMRTGPALFRHWREHVRDLTGSVYGRGMYEVMRYWDEDRPEWGAEQQERSEEHTSELQSLMRISYAVFCLKQKKKNKYNPNCTI